MFSILISFLEFSKRFLMMNIFSVLSEDGDGDNEVVGMKSLTGKERNSPNLNRKRKHISTIQDIDEEEDVHSHNATDKKKERAREKKKRKKLKNILLENQNILERKEPTHIPSSSTSSTSSATPLPPSSSTPLSSSPLTPFTDDDLTVCIRVLHHIGEDLRSHSPLS